MLRVAGPLTEGRDRFVRGAAQRNIGARSTFIPLPTQPYYSRHPTVPAGRLSVPIASSSASPLPIYSRMTDVDVDDVIAAVLEILTSS